jgi:hypothetical protein
MIVDMDARPKLLGTKLAVPRQELEPAWPGGILAHFGHPIGGGQLRSSLVLEQAARLSMIPATATRLSSQAHASA